MILKNLGCIVTSIFVPVYVITKLFYMQNC